MPEVTAYLNRLRLGSYRPETIRVRRRVLTTFARSLPEGTTIRTATRLDVEAFIARDLAPNTMRAYLSSLRSFYTWAVDEQLVSADPTQRMPSVRVPKGTPRPMGEQDFRRALAAADGRTYAWILLMALGGLRCCEVARLRPQDIVQDQTDVLLYLRETKGGGSATVPAHVAILEALAPLPIRDGLWWSLTPQGVTQHMSIFLRGIGILSGAHSLRHYAATSWIRASKYDLLTTARLMRHASVSTTEIYAQIGPERPAEVVDLVPFVA